MGLWWKLMHCIDSYIFMVYKDSNKDSACLHSLAKLHCFVDF